MRTLPKTARKIGVFLLFAGLCASLTSCCEYNAKYDAVLYDDGSKYLQESFMEENPITFTDEEQSPGVYVRHYSFPLFLIQDQDGFETAFRDDSGFKMNFDKRMVVLFSPHDIYHEKLYFRSVSAKEKELRIEIENRHASCLFACGDVSAIYQRWLVITLKKIQIDRVLANYNPLAR